MPTTEQRSGFATLRRLGILSEAGELRVTTVPRADDSPNNPKPASLDVTGVGWMASGLDDGVENFSARSTADIATD